MLLVDEIVSMKIALLIRYSTLWWSLGFGCALNLVYSTHRNVPFRGCVGQIADNYKQSKSCFDILAR
jgi:hypothetical protein